MAFRVVVARNYSSYLTRTVSKRHQANAYPRFDFCSRSSLCFFSHRENNASRNLCVRASRYQPTPIIPPSFYPLLRSGLSASRASYSTKPGYSERVKVILKEYGRVGFVFYMIVSLTSLGTCYLLVNNGLDVVKILKYFNVEMEESSLTKGASTFAIAYVFHKFLLPIRATVTIAGVPMIVRALRSRGWIQEPMKKVRDSVKKQATK